MKYYAIQRKKDGLFVSGSDRRYDPPHCIMADEYRPPLLLPFDLRLANIERICRRINLKQYKIVVIEIKEVEG